MKTKRKWFYILLINKLKRINMPKEERSEASKNLSDRVLQVVEMARNTGKIRKGTNETTKAIEKGVAKLVVIAEDVDPIEIVMHLPALCDEKKVPYFHVPSKLELGRAIGIDVPSAAVCIVDPGEGKEALNNVVKQLAESKKQ